MSYNPNIHHRKSLRLTGYDYSQAGAYFITICCHKRIHRFGEIENNEMILNEYGTHAYNEWAKLPERFNNFVLDGFQIMPNHMHGIIILNAVEAGFTPSQIENNNNEIGQPPGLTLTISDDINDIPIRPNASVGDIVGAYKSLVANKCLKIFKLKNRMMGKFWQRNYYEHIVRNEQSYQTISKYIVNNPKKWGDDKFYY
ncbi:transposase [Cyclobacterium qasimii]|uniref:Transposase IS200-like domain-containing protein n=2 Tax=Cyclobacterium qasimii TaxID=1350429 RepID=S7V6T4_9BACT|nr:transposase [Cyclobacterium qasimii]EPR65297.1 hypothetical protein ADICYQ_5830 [Cyclobacterium qasimii M12-11B]GEO21902.1 hypothetical protein CQA01_24360 [Cyclobacterium qasimii]